MARIEKYQFWDFNTKYDSNIVSFPCPANAKFLGKVKVLHDGIYAFYTLSEILMASADVKTETFMVANPKQGVPDDKDWEFIDILDAIFEVPQGNSENPAEPTQGMMIFPIFKKRT